jgi:AcrR family transcriptional regulator
VTARAVDTKQAGALSSTRERILHEASNMFASRGYHGTSTREIARAVGIRQPSLFHHFTSKEAILQALLSFDLDEAVPFAEAVARGPAPAPLRLYRYLHHDVLHLTGSPYNLSGLYAEEVIGRPEFAPWARKRQRLHAAIERILSDGVADGSFIEVPVVLVREAITGILLRTLALYSGRPADDEDDLADQIASLVIRAVVDDTDRLAEIRLAARTFREGG